MNAARFAVLADRFTRVTNLINYNSAYSVLFWFLVDTLPSTNRNVFTLEADSNNTDVLRINASNQLQLRCGNAGSFTNTNGTVTLSAGTWYHLALVRASATDLQLYMNGTSDITNTRDVTGRGSNALEEVCGSALEARVASMKAWSTNLSSADIAKEMGYQWPQTNPTARFETWPILPGSRRVTGIRNGYNWTEAGTVIDSVGPPNVIEIPGPMALTVVRPNMLLRR